MNYQDFLEKSSNDTNDNLIKELNKYKKENSELKQEIKKLKEEKDKYYSDLAKANKIISNINKNPKKDEDSINKINNLKNELKMKEKEINDLKKELLNKGNIKQYVDYNNIIVVHFISGDGQVNQGIKCLKTDTFAEVEEKLYKIYNEYRETNNIFLSGGSVVLRFKTIDENKIKDGDKIQLQVPVE